MIECALYGMVRERFRWKGENFSRVEKFYSNGREKVFVNSRTVRRDGCDAGGGRSGSTADNCDSSLSEEAGRGADEAQVHEIVSRDTPDRNKQKTSVITKIRRAVVKDGQDPDRLLTSLGYTLVSTNTVEVHRYYKNGYVIELSRFVRDGCPDGGERPKELYEYFLVKAFTEAGDGLADEAVLNSAFLDLEDDVQLIKPPLSWF